MATATMKRALLSWEESQTAKSNLLGLLGDNRNIYTIIRTVSASGMSRTISVKMVHNGEIIDITYTVAKALEEKCISVNGHNAIRVNGCGMDMAWNLVYSLSSVLFAGQDRPGYELNHRHI